LNEVRMSLDLATPEPVLEVRDLHAVFHTIDGPVHAVNGVSFSLARGELLGVVGESGSGKSVTMMSLLKLLPMPPTAIVTGSVRFAGRELTTMRPARLRRLCGGQIGFVLQDAMTALNPVLTIGFQVMEPLRRHLKLSRAAARRRAVELLDLVGIASAAHRLDEYPHQFSGGMRQRVTIAIAVACGPKLLIADEPTTALDVTVQAQILDLARKLQSELRMAIIWVTHDLGVVAGIADRVIVMYGGKVVEHAPVCQLYGDPQHPYTRALLETLPVLDDDGRTRRLRLIPGQPPGQVAHLAACPFHPRCAHAIARCHVENPPLIPVGPLHGAACWWDLRRARPRDV
jgi:oligopeptide transport system ATP-binding protein